MRAAELAVPVGIFVLLAYALVKKVNIYKAFVEGAAAALPQLVSILPSLAAMLSAIEMLRSSGALTLAVRLLSPVSEKLGVPAELVPLILLRPFSGSASLAMLKDTLLSCGADGFTGRAASVVVGSTETIFYTTAVYFGAVGVTKTRQSIPAALISGAVGTAVGLALVRIM